MLHFKTIDGFAPRNITPFGKRRVAISARCEIGHGVTLPQPRAEQIKRNRFHNRRYAGALGLPESRGAEFVNRIG